MIADTTRRNNWERGRVQKIIRGEDGRIRQAIVQTARGMIKRAVAKLVVLEVDGEGKTESETRSYGGEDVGSDNTAHRKESIKEID